ncbi:amidohydrolase [Flavilitoribacter nigricans DSM 23189 = NBRC 102662]|uniref:Amidohydrolase n=2 Tax=Flavilitoribacter TaxID=2762562 RepID=A0A2D0MXX6_FLAN2|nr:amidohydrolase [Flavilitoribacter nigricans DSM 23189 = NBRC 102662]
MHSQSILWGRSLPATFLIPCLLTLLLASTACRQTTKPTADLIVTNARIWTGDEANTVAEAMAIGGDTILAVGDLAEIEDYRGEQTASLDAAGKLIVPGFIDSHVHFMNGGLGLASIQLRDAKTPEAFARRFAEYVRALEPGTWILEGNWDHEQWGGELPTREWIDRYTPNNPVFVQRLDGHMALANSAALEAAGVTQSTEEVFGGTIVRDAAGVPTGILKDNAMGLVYPSIPDPGVAQEDRALRAAMEFVASHGVTSIHNMDPGGIGLLEAYERLRAANQQITRFYVALGLRHWMDLRDKIQEDGAGDRWLKIGVLKAMIDGSLGSHTAAFFEPFTDAPQDTGLFVNRPDSLYRWIKGADAAGLQVAVHAIGDKAIHEVLNTFEQVAAENGPKDRRFRIEHAQHIAPADIPRFAAQGVIASMQPYHAIDDGRWADKVIGEARSKTTYAFRSLLDAEADLAFGSDWFVAPPTPLEGIYAAVTRRTLDDAHPDGWVPEQKITVTEALRAYTMGAAFAAFEEDLKGSLEPGKLADFVILDRNIFEIAPETIREARVEKTIVGGKVVFARQ